MGDAIEIKSNIEKSDASQISDLSTQYISSSAFTENVATTSSSNPKAKKRTKKVDSEAGASSNEVDILINFADTVLYFLLLYFAC